MLPDWFYLLFAFFAGGAFFWTVAWWCFEAKIADLEQIIKALRSTLAAILEETFYILEIAYFHVGGKGLRRIEQLTVACEDVTDLSLWNGHERGGMDNVLDWHQIVHTTAQYLGLKARFAIQGNKSVLH